MNKLLTRTALWAAITVGILLCGAAVYELFGRKPQGFDVRRVLLVLPREGDAIEMTFQGRTTRLPVAFEGDCRVTRFADGLPVRIGGIEAAFAGDGKDLEGAYDSDTLYRLRRGERPRALHLSVVYAGRKGLPQPDSLWDANAWLLSMRSATWLRIDGNQVVAADGNALSAWLDR